MGALNSVWKKFYGKKPVRILILGLDAAGKTTMLYQLKLGEIVTTIPTIGFNVETLDYKNMNITMWDIGGRDKMRPLYRHYFANTNAVIFVVDSADKERMEETKEEIQRMVVEDELRSAPILIVANKQDLVGALSVMSIAERLELSKIKQPWYIVPAVATQGKGLHDGLDWLSGKLGQNCVQDDVTNHVARSIQDVQDSVSKSKTINYSWQYLAKSWCTISTWWGPSKAKLNNGG